MKMTDKQIAERIKVEQDKIAELCTTEKQFNSIKDILWILANLNYRLGQQQTKRELS